MMICSPSQYQKARLQEHIDVEELDWESDDAVESEGSGPPSLTSSSADDNEEVSYRQRFIEERRAGKIQRKDKEFEPTADENLRNV
jgi:hypothetical protein